MRGDIRESDIQRLLERVRKRNYEKYLTSMRLLKLRGFSEQEIRFDFPVTALVGPNGAGKTTILGAAGLIYRDVPPRRFFAKSGSYDESMKGWKIEYELVDRDRSTTPTSVSRTASYLKAKWNRDAVARPVVIVGIGRTLPVSERTDGYKFVGADFKGAREINFTPSVVDAVEHILGKAAASYIRVDADSEGRSSIFAVREARLTGDNYSEFHFGAGEASIIRIVSEIEQAPNNALILIEEIENGLHPVATRRLVEYLVTVARTKSCQVIFTTHSNDALGPLPNEGVWSTYRGRLAQGKLDVAALRTLTGQIDARIAVFTEDAFDEMFADVTLRTYGGRNSIERAGIKIHSLGGASQARDHTRFHNANPTRTFPAVCLLDGDMRGEDGFAPTTFSDAPDKSATSGWDDLVYTPGDSDPEEAVFEDVKDNLDAVPNLVGKLTLAMQLDTPMQAAVRSAIETRASTNRDRHTIYGQIGEDLDFLSETLVQRAFVTTWAYAFPEKVDAIWRPCHELLRGGGVS